MAVGAPVFAVEVSLDLLDLPEVEVAVESQGLLPQARSAPRAPLLPKAFGLQPVSFGWRTVRRDRFGVVGTSSCIVGVTKSSWLVGVSVVGLVIEIIVDVVGVVF